MYLSVKVTRSPQKSGGCSEELDLVRLNLSATVCQINGKWCLNWAQGISRFPTQPLAYPFIHPCLHSFISVSTHLHINPSILFPSSLIHPPTSTSVHPSFFPSFLHLSIHPPLSPASICPSIPPPIHLSIFPSFISLSILLPSPTSICPSNHPPIHPSIFPSSSLHPSFSQCICIVSTPCQTCRHSNKQALAFILTYKTSLGKHPSGEWTIIR